MANPIRSRAVAPTLQLADFDAAFDRCFSMVAFQMNRHFIDHMLRVGRQFTDDDYEAMLIWGVLAHQNVAHMLPPGSHPCAVLNERGRIAAGPGRRPLRLRDLAQITRIPRETVRRKLEKLAAAGWIERCPDGWMVSVAPIDTDLREFSREQVRRFLGAAEDVLRTLRETEEQLMAERRPTGRTSTGSPAASPTTPDPGVPAAA